jgi:hypothetical protein
MSLRERIQTGRYGPDLACMITKRSTLLSNIKRTAAATGMHVTSLRLITSPTNRSAIGSVPLFRLLYPVYASQGPSCAILFDPWLIKVLHQGFHGQGWVACFLEESQYFLFGRRHALIGDLVNQVRIAGTDGSLSKLFGHRLF